MKPKKRTKLPMVELLNVPSYQQGSFDSLCTYYTTAMMLVTLFPEYEANFGQVRGVRVAKYSTEDPIFSNHSNGDSRLALATWFYKGEHIRKSTTILNKLMKEKSATTRFQCLSKTAHDNTYTVTIKESIDEGLPVMMGWNTPDYGDHAVLVRGYWEGKEKWLLINDPGSGEDQISWNSLKEQKTTRFEIGICKSESHSGYRPLKRTTEGTGKRQKTTTERWTRENRYLQVDEEFE